MTTCLSEWMLVRFRCGGLGLGVMALLAACGGTSGGLFDETGQTGLSAATPDATVSLAGGALRFTGPAGYCVEPRSHRNAATGSFALVAGCNAIRRNPGSDAVPAGYATIVVGPRPARPVPPETLLREASGGSAAGFQRGPDGLVMLRAAPDDSGVTWRGAVSVDDWPILISLYGTDGTLGADRATGLIRALAAGVQANPRAVAQDPA